MSAFRALSAAAVLTIVGAFPPASAAADCRQIHGAFQAAAQAGDLSEVRRQYDAAWAEPTCDDAYRQNIGRVAALLHVRIAQRRIGEGQSLQAQGELLTQALSFGRPWQVLALLGDMYHDQSEYARASELYQEALTAIDDPEATPQAPPLATIETIFQRAAQSQLLAEEYIPAPIDRAGEPGGLAQEDIRGFRPKETPVPITFEYDSTAFTGKGREAAADMAAYLIRQAPARITVAGHTDERGAVAYNQELSQARARRVAEFLRERGFAGEITAVGKGESEPFTPDDPAKYTQEQRYTMDRRVELAR
jgi:outer membrane protein OmpA-like peptidoglycan-associated protein